MDALLDEILTEMSKAEVRESKKSYPPCYIFEEETYTRYEFNGFRCPNPYQDYCESFITRFKQRLRHKDLNKELDYDELRWTKIEIEDFLHRFFSTDDSIMPESRIVANKSLKIHDRNLDVFHEQIRSFMSIQQKTLKRILLITNESLKHHSKILYRNPYDSSLKTSLSQNYPENIQNGFMNLGIQEPQNSLHFMGNKVDFEVLIDVLWRIKAFKLSDNSYPKKSYLREILSVVWNFQHAKNPAATLNAARDRAEKSPTIITRLLAAYEDFKAEKLFNETN